MNTKKKYVIGLMSGTSLDGLDLVYVSFEKNINFVFNILAAKTYSYSDIWVHKLKRAFNKNLNELSFVMYAASLLSTNPDSLSSSS